MIKRAQRAKVKIALVKREDFPSKADFEKMIIKQLKSNHIGLIIMAGFMRMLGKELLKVYKNRILNIHPALLPSFKGASGIKEITSDYGVKVTGMTISTL